MSPNKKDRTSKINSILIENIPAILHNDLLSNNLIEKDLQSVLRPLNVMQAAFICAKYTIRNNFITANTSLYNIVAVVNVIIFQFIGLFRIISSFTGWGVGLDLFLTWNKISKYILLSLGLILNYHTNITQSHNNVSLVLKIQKVHRVLKISSKNLRSILIYNWVAVVCVNSICFGSILFLYVTFGRMDIFDTISLTVTMSFDINVVYSSFLMKLMSKMLNVWIEDVKKSGNVSDLGRCYWKSMSDVFLNIVEAYRIVEITFQRQILYYTIITVCHALLNVATLLQIKLMIADGEPPFVLLTIFSQIWILKNNIIEIYLSVECERFYTAMRDVHCTCTLLMNPRYSDTQRRACKNIQRLQKASFKKMEACGVFIINAAMSLRLFSIITTYTIVLLQFTFL